MTALTERQKKLLAFIEKEIRYAKGFPTFREMMDHMGVKSPNTITHYLSALERKGYLNNNPDGGTHPLRGEWTLSDEHYQVKARNAKDLYKLYEVTLGHLRNAMLKANYAEPTVDELVQELRSRFQELTPLRR